MCRDQDATSLLCRVFSRGVKSINYLSFTDSACSVNSEGHFRARFNQACPLSSTSPFVTPFTSFFPRSSLLFFTEFARSSSTVSVSSQPMQASVMETPYFRPALPSGGIFWLPTPKSKISHVNQRRFDLEKRMRVQARLQTEDGGAHLH